MGRGIVSERYPILRCGGESFHGRQYFPYERQRFAWLHKNIANVAARAESGRSARLESRGVRPVDSFRRQRESSSRGLTGFLGLSKMPQPLMLILRGGQGVFMGVSFVRVYRHTAPFSSNFDEGVFLCQKVE